MSLNREETIQCPGTFWQHSLIFFIASNAALLFTIFFGLYLWPDRLPVNSQNIFWLASGVNTAGLLILGLRYWPVLLLNAFPAAFLAGEPMGLCLLAASANAMEALLGAWFIRKVGGFVRCFDTLRSVGALLLASLVAPLVNTVLIPAYFCIKGVYQWSEYPKALGNWNLANGSAILLIAPLIISIVGSDWTLVSARSSQRWERVFTAMVTAVLSWLAFAGLFSGKGMNLAFLAFPPILYTAVRFGIGETAVALNIVLLSIYSTLFLYAGAQPNAAMPSVLWFAQAIVWVLSATGYLIAALGGERRQAERASLEASLAAGQAHLSALRYQINPHFLFNALNSIRATLPLSEEKAREMITSLSHYFRSTLKGDGDNWCLLDAELKDLQAYIRIEHYRFGSDLVVRLEIEPEAEQFVVPAFLLQPLVENAIRHGLEKNPCPCEIVVAARLVKGNLHLSVSNSGEWQVPSAQGGMGIGLQNLEHRLRLCYGSRATLSIDKFLGSVQIRMVLPPL